MPEKIDEYYLGEQVLLAYLGNWPFIANLCE